MNHADAVIANTEHNGRLWGGFSDLVTPELLARWTSHWEDVYDKNEVAILKEMISGEFTRFTPLIWNNRPDGDEFVKAGLHDTEGEVAVADYMRYRAQEDRPLNLIHNARLGDSNE